MKQNRTNQPTESPQALPSPEPAWPGAPAYCSQRPRPAYPYRRGLPHPTRDPQGHSYGAEEPHPPPIDPARWHESDDYLYAVDLYHEGYFWEAHEAWEGLWHAAGRDTTAQGCFIRGLIRLAAAQLKLQAGMPRGVCSHSRAAYALTENAEMRVSPPDGHYLGVDLADLRSQIARFFGPIWACEGACLDTSGPPPRLRLRT